MTMGITMGICEPGTKILDWARFMAEIQQTENHTDGPSHNDHSGTGTDHTKDSG